MDDGDGGSAFDVAVIGAGVVGLAVADSLARRGATVAILDRSKRWGIGCSLANAGLICPSHSSPYATTQDLAQAARWVFRAGSPFAVRPHAGLVPWLARLLASTREAEVARSTEVLVDLARESLALHLALDGTEHAIGLAQSGLLDVYETDRALNRGIRNTRRAAELGLSPQVLGASDVAHEEPEIARRVAGGILYPLEAFCDPVLLANALGESAVESGARFIGGVRVNRIDEEGGLVRLRWARGEVRSTGVVIAAGIDSGDLARTVGANLPLQPGKGYSIDLTSATSDLTLRRPMMLQERRVAVTPYGGKVRLAGMMHLGHWDNRIDAVSIASLRKSADCMLANARPAQIERSWAGLRPCTPDGVPLVGWIRRGRIAVATGHGMLGVTLAPITGQILAELFDGAETRFGRELSPDRFRSWAATRGSRLRRAG